MALPDGGAAVFAVATRITQLNGEGAPEANALSYTTEQLIEATIAPVNETGDDIAHKNAAGNLAVFAKHGDMPKYYDVTLDLAIPDPNLESILCGGAVYEDKTVALTLPSIPTLTTKTGTGTLKAGTYGYRTSAVNQYGETEATAQVTAVLGAEGEVLVAVEKLPATSLFGRVYGRTPGAELLLGTVVNIGEQEAKEVPAAEVEEVKLEKGTTTYIPAGTTFRITPDAGNTLFTTTAAVLVGSTVIPVVKVKPTGIIAAKGKISPVFVDNGSVAPNGQFQTVNTTAGPGAGVGYQAPALGFTGSTLISLEFYEKAIVGGTQAVYLPYWRIVVPMARNFVVESRSVKNDSLASKFKGNAFQNTNWGSGPFGDWQFDSSKVIQRARCAAQIVPAVGFSSTPAYR
jgi:hypothetical protein